MPSSPHSLYCQSCRGTGFCLDCTTTIGPFSIRCLICGARDVSNRYAQDPDRKRAIARTVTARAKRDPVFRRRGAEAARLGRLKDWQNPEYRTTMHHVAVKSGLASKNYWHHYEFLDRRGRVYDMRSSWEVKFAEYADRQSLTWDYEPVLLLSTGERYKIDFWVAEWNSYVEIKGFPYSLKKYKQAVADGVPVRLIDSRGMVEELLDNPAGIDVGWRRV